MLSSPNELKFSHGLRVCKFGVTSEVNAGLLRHDEWQLLPLTAYWQPLTREARLQRLVRCFGRNTQSHL